MRFKLKPLQLSYEILCCALSQLYLISSGCMNEALYFQIMTVCDPVPGQFDDVDQEEDINNVQTAVNNKLNLNEDTPSSDDAEDEELSDDNYSDDYFDVEEGRTGDNPNQQMAKTKLSHY